MALGKVFIRCLEILNIVLFLFFFLSIESRYCSHIVDPDCDLFLFHQLLQVLTAPIASRHPELLSFFSY